MRAALIWNQWFILFWAVASFIFGPSFKRAAVIWGERIVNLCETFTLFTISKLIQTAAGSSIEIVVAAACKPTLIRIDITAVSCWFNSRINSDTLMTACTSMCPSIIVLERSKVTAVCIFGYCYFSVFAVAV